MILNKINLIHQIFIEKYENKNVNNFHCNF